jgi:hypothetical protein
MMSNGPLYIYIIVGTYLATMPTSSSCMKVETEV